MHFSPNNSGFCIQAAAQIAVLKGYDEAWASWFEAEPINPLRIAYDHLAKDPHSVVQRVLLALGKDAEPARTLRPPVRKMADAINEDWARQFGQDDGI